MEKVTKRKFTESFRAEAVRMVLEQGQTTAEVARKLEISDKSLANWVRKGRRRAPSSVPVAVDRAARPVSELEAEVSRLRADQADVTTTAVSGGNARRCQELANAARAFGSYPLSIDGWMGALFDFSGPRQQSLPETWVSSYQFDGSSTVDCLPIRFGLDYQGIESITTPAGTFRCHYFVYLLAGSAIDHPPYETWVTTDGTSTLARARAGSPLDYTYEFVGLV